MNPALALYHERYLLLTQADSPLAGRSAVGWAEAAELPLCALNVTMQNRRILERAAAVAGARLRPVVEADTVAALSAHAATGRWSSIIAHTWLQAFGVPAGMCVVPLAEPSPRPVVGLITASHRPRSMLVDVLIDAIQASDVAAVLDDRLG